MSQQILAFKEKLHNWCLFCQMTQRKTRHSRTNFNNLDYKDSFEAEMITDMALRDEILMVEGLKCLSQG